MQFYDFFIIIANLNYKKNCNFKKLEVMNFRILKKSHITVIFSQSTSVLVKCPRSSSSVTMVVNFRFDEPWGGGEVKKLEKVASNLRAQEPGVNVL